MEWDFRYVGAAATSRPEASSTAICAGVQPLLAPTEPELSSACKNAWVMKGLERSSEKPASAGAPKGAPPSGLAQASQAAASISSIEGTIRIFKVEVMDWRSASLGKPERARRWRSF